MNPDDLKNIADMIPESTRKELLDPTPHTIGEATGTILKYLSHSLDFMRRSNYISDHNMNDFKSRVDEQIGMVSKKDLDTTQALLMIKAIDDSKYQLNKDYMRNAFAKLIAHIADKSVNWDYSPVFSSLLANMSVPEAELLIKLKSSPNMAISICRVRKQLLTDSNNYQFLSEYAMIFPDGTIRFDDQTNLALQLLSQSGLVEIKENFQLSADWYQTHYKKFDNSSELSTFKINNPITSEWEYHVVRGDAELTLVGKTFANIIS